MHSTNRPRANKARRKLRFLIGLALIILGVVAMSIAIILDKDWTGLLFVGGFISATLGLIIAKTDATDIFVSLLRGWW